MRITKVLTAESSGIALACFVARALDVPAVYAKKFQTGYIDPEVYSAETHSFSLENPIPCGSLKSTWTGTTWFSW